jgi:hypothetical protein
MGFDDAQHIALRSPVGAFPRRPTASTSEGEQAATQALNGILAAGYSGMSKNLSGANGDQGKIAGVCLA